MSGVFPSFSIRITELRGDEVAWNRLCDKFRVGLRSKSRYLIETAGAFEGIGSDVLVQETLLEAGNKRDAFRGHTTSQFAKWMLTILRKTYLESCRNELPELTVAHWFSFSDHGATPSTSIISLEQEADLHACLAELDSQFQIVLFLRHFEGLKFAEIAERTGWEINSVAGIYRSGLQRLTMLLDYQKDQNSLPALLDTFADPRLRQLDSPPTFHR